jgi:hypothetical protein
MAFRRLYPTKDTFVANYDGLLEITASNMGASEILNLYSGTIEFPNQKANILIQFDWSATGTMPTGSATPVYKLQMFDAQHSQSIPTNYQAWISPMTQDWSEGAGHDLDYYTDSGMASWMSASTTASWTIFNGGYPDYVSLPYATETFSTGHEDLNVDVTDLLANHAADVVNKGLFIQVQPLLPTGSNYYIKKFHSRHTHFVTKKPFLEVAWADWTGTLTTSTLYISTVGAFSGTEVPQWLTASHTASTVHVTNSLVDPTGALVASMPHLRPIYFSVETVRMQLKVRPFDYNPSVVATASADSPGTVLMDAYYRIVNERSGEVLVPFDEVSKSTKLSWNDYGNYFDIHMGSLPTGTLMRFDYLYNISGSSTMISGSDFTFRIE